jgi:hypothetical protein
MKEIHGVHNNPPDGWGYGLCAAGGIRQPTTNEWRAE